MLWFLFLDSQGEFLYSPSHKKQHLIGQSGEAFASDRGLLMGDTQCFLLASLKNEGTDAEEWKTE
jgi:hypothetical protein